MASIPTATAAQMAEVDRIMMHDLGVDMLQLMEVAGLAVAEAARRMLGGDVAGSRVLLLAGSGGNGGDALVAARHLVAWGATPVAVLSKRALSLPDVTAKQYRLAMALGVPIREPGDEPPGSNDTYDLIVDGLLGFSGRGNPRGVIAELIHLANDHPAPVLAIDIPSGLDATTGVVGDPCIHADATVTLVLPKQGFLSPDAREVSGEVTVATIGVPAGVLERVGITVSPSLFSESQAIRWDAGG